MKCIVPDTSAVIIGAVSDVIKTENLDFPEVIVSEAVSFPDSAFVSITLSAAVSVSVSLTGSLTPAVSMAILDSAAFGSGLSAADVPLPEPAQPANIPADNNTAAVRMHNRFAVLFIFIKRSFSLICYNEP